MKFLKRKTLKDVPCRRFVKLTKVITVYKSVGVAWSGKLCSEHAIATLCLPKGTVVYTGDLNTFNGFCRLNKMRANKAKVIRIQRICDSTTYAPRSLAHDVKYAESRHTSGFKYRVGRTVKPDMMYRFFDYKECSHGIHFFRTVEEALTY